MSDIDRESDSATPNKARGTDRWVFRGVMALVVLVFAFLAYKIGASFLPRWWAQRIGDQVDGSFSKGITWGLFYGFVFSFIPIVVAFQVRRRMFKIPGKIIVFVIAVLLATPNWLSLLVALSNRPAAVAAWQTFNVQAPSFLWSSLVGAVIGGVLGVATSTTSIWLKHRRNQVKSLKQQVRDEREKHNKPDEAEPS
ncbi:hypothetical protein BH09ACT10_BH09ACT10_17390 [soil metagenome]